MKLRATSSLTTAAAVVAVAWTILTGPAAPPAHAQRVGDRTEQGGVIVSTRQVIRPAGQSVEWHGRPVDLALSPDHRTAYLKSSKELVVVDATANGWTIRQQLTLPDKTGASAHGISVSPDGSRLWLTVAQSKLVEGIVNPQDKTITWGRRIHLPAVGLPPGARNNDSYPCGIALSPDGNWALVCLSTANALAEVDLTDGRQTRAFPVGVAPFDVVASPDGARVYVSNWGGRHPRPKGADGGGGDDRTMVSHATPVVVDARGVASTGTVTALDAETGRAIAEIPVGLHPGDLELSPDGRRLYVANANSDSVSVIDTDALAVVETIPVKPDPNLPWGSSPNGLCLSPDAKTLYVAVGGNNAIAVVSLATGNSPLATITGFIPAGWFPGAVATDGDSLFVANVKGVGSRDPVAKGKWNSHSYWGTATRAPVPATADELKAHTARVRADALVPEALRAWERGQRRAEVPPVPVPERLGEPSVFEHVVYVIKENRTYDQVFGDLPAGNGEPALCTFGRHVTPNQHALAEQFVLLDNYYCNGVLSADGHAWSTEGYAVDSLEKSFGGWTRSYPFSGDDPLAFAPTGFLWDNALLHGLTFRNHGEFVVTTVVPDARGAAVYKDYLNNGGQFRLEHKLALEPLRAYTNPDCAGWSMKVPDQQRVDAFLKEFRQRERDGRWENLSVLFLPTDHTAGTGPGAPAPASMVADNDLAVGRLVEAISHSRFWPKTCIFIIEDDPQNGFDHVDGHRSTCLVISPYTRRGAVVSAFFNQTSVLHTMERMLGLPPMNQMDAMAPLMRECFTDAADLRPFKALPPNVSLEDVNPAKAEIKGRQLEMAELSERQDFDRPDAAEEDALNRILWYASRGWDAEYPSAWAGAHGRGLARLKLKLDGNVREDDDD